MPKVIMIKTMNHKIGMAKKITLCLLSQEKVTSLTPNDKLSSTQLFKDSVKCIWPSINSYGKYYQFEINQNPYQRIGYLAGYGSYFEQTKNSGLMDLPPTPESLQGISDKEMKSFINVSKKYFQIENQNKARIITEKSEELWLPESLF